MFGEHLDPGTLEEIIDALEVSLKSVFQRLVTICSATDGLILIVYARSNEQARIRKAVELLKGMDNVSRIETLTMFLEPKHQKGSSLIQLPYVVQRKNFAHVSLMHSYPRAIGQISKL
jgi:hypothetical protein